MAKLKTKLKLNIRACSPRFIGAALPLIFYFATANTESAQGGSDEVAKSKTAYRPPQADR